MSKIRTRCASFRIGHMRRVDPDTRIRMATQGEEGDVVIYEIEIEREDDGRYIAEVVGTSIVTYGATEEEARRAALALVDEYVSQGPAASRSDSLGNS